MNAPLWAADDLARIPGSRLVGEPGPVCGISIDTRTLAAGDLYFAISGDVHDGHDFVPAALAKAAAAAVVKDTRAADFADAGPLVAVPDVLAAMGDLGR